MTKALLLAFLIIPFLVVGSTSAQGVSVNQQGDVIYLGTTTTTTTTVITSPTPASSPSPNTSSINLNPGGTNVPVGDSYFYLPQGFFPDFRTMITSLLQIALIASVIIVLFQLVTAGLNWITSGGDKAKTDSARSKIVAAIIGLVLVVASWAIFLFILQLIGLAPGSVIPFSS